MPTFTFTGPDGKKYSVAGPEGATEQQAFQMLQTQLGTADSAPAEPECKLDGDCTGLADAAKKASCMKEMDDYFLSTVRRGRVRDGRVYMPPFESTLTQEAIWSIRTYIETRREP